MDDMLKPRSRPAQDHHLCHSSPVVPICHTRLKVPKTHKDVLSCAVNDPRCRPATPPIQGSSLCAALRTPLHTQVLPFIRHKVHAELVGAPIASSRGATPLLSLRGSSYPSSTSSKPRVRRSLRCPRVLKNHLLQAVLQRSFRRVCAIVEGDSALDAKLTLKASIVSQSLNDLFDKVVYRVSPNIPKRRSK
ncbi:hypothetical protein ABHI18_001733 [Aspergillus niger]